jgi:hypothetical protein
MQHFGFGVKNMKKSTSKLTKTKIILYIFIVITFLVGTCALALAINSVGNITKYWLYFIISNYVSIITFCIAALILGALIIFDPNRNQKIIGIIAFLGITLICGLIFINLALPLDRDVYIMMTKSYSEVNGSLLTVNAVHTGVKLRQIDTELTIHDINKNENITINFFNPTSTNFRVGENINVKYLPHSHMGISYSYINESVPFSLLSPI